MFPVDESMHERFVAAQVPGDEERQTIDWIVSTCASRKNVKKIVLHLDRERAPDSAHRFTNNIASALKEPYEVIQAFR
jgi:hypothetical protein